MTKRCKAMASRPLILMCGGGHCKSVIEAAESAGFVIRGILDVDERVGSDVLGYKIIGTDANLHKYVAECDFVITLGFIKDPSVRCKLINKAEAAGCRFATVVASTAHVSRHATVGKGTVVLHHATINAGATVGRHCIINTAANVEHDAQVGDGAHVSTGVMLNGESHVGRNAFVGSGSVVAQCVKIADGAIVGAGSVVVCDITAPGVYAGNPARLIEKKRQ